jgi:anti-anti-sigma regulatory factor
MPRAKKMAARGARPKHGSGKSAKARAKPRKPVAASAEAEAEAETEMQSSPMVETSEADSQTSSAALMLPECLDASAATAVKEMLLARRGSALVVDASQVRRVGAQPLQILIAAARTWQADGQAYCVSNPSGELLETMALIGLAHGDLMLEGAMQ